MSNFAPNLSSGPCSYCGKKAKIGPEELVRCDLCRQTIHMTCLKSGMPNGKLLGDNFFSVVCSSCQQNGQDTSVRATLTTLQLLLLVLYNLHMTQEVTARGGFFHWKVHIYQFINQHWKEIFGPDRHKKKKKALQASLSGQLSHYGQYFVSGYETLKDGGWYKLIAVLPPAQLIQQHMAGKSKGTEIVYVKEECDEEDVDMKEEPVSPVGVSLEGSNHDESSQGSWFMEKDILRPNNLPPQSLFDSEEEAEASTSEKAKVAGPKTNRKRKAQDPTEELVEMATKRLREPQDDTDKIAAAWAVKLRKMEPQQQMFAVKAVEDIMFEGQMGTLHRNSVEINASRASTPYGIQPTPSPSLSSRASTPYVIQPTPSPSVSPV